MGGEDRQRNERSDVPSDRGAGALPDDPNARPLYRLPVPLFGPLPQAEEDPFDPAGQAD